MNPKSLVFSLLYYVSVANWKIDEMDKKHLGIIYAIILFSLLIFSTPAWLFIVVCISVPRILYLLGVIDHFQKKVE